jgi:hypothetical protein
MRRRKQIRHFDLLDEIEMRQLLHFGIDNRLTGIWVDDAAKVWTGLGLQIGVVPVLAELSLVFAGDQESGNGTAPSPFLASHLPQVSE